MDIDGLEKRINKHGNVSYWKDGVKLYKQCSKCKEIKLMEEYNKAKREKDGRSSSCKKCKRKYAQEHIDDRRKYNEENKERIKRVRKEYFEKNKERIRKRHNEYMKEHRKEKALSDKKYREKNREKLILKKREYYLKNKEIFKEKAKRYREENKEKKAFMDKLYVEKNREKVLDYKKRYYLENKERIDLCNAENKKRIKEENIERITMLLKQINPILQEKDIKAYGFIYKFKNIKTGRVYIGQTTQDLNLRYHYNIIENWIKERKAKKNQKFIEELIEENIEVIEILDVGICRYHLDKLEVYYINKYDSFLNGYNNQMGKHDTDDGLEEFIEMLQQHNLEFIDGQIVKKAN